MREAIVRIGDLVPYSDCVYRCVVPMSARLDTSPIGIPLLL